MYNTADYYMPERGQYFMTPNGPVLFHDAEEFKEYMEEYYERFRKETEDMDDDEYDAYLDRLERDRFEAGYY